MADLQDLKLMRTPSLSSSAGLSSLPGSLTELRLRDQRVLANHGDGPSLPQSLQQLSALLQLESDACAFHPNVLVDFASLQRLDLDDCVFRECTTENGDSLSGVEALLHALQQLKLLQEQQLQLLQELQLATSFTPGLLSGQPSP